MSEPVFAVVGHANPGKSSIVSTLAADDSVRVGPLPGTTQKCRHFPMRVDGQTLYTLIDTPGFERPRQVLQWLNEHATSTADRRQTVEQFVGVHSNAKKFSHECELLKPILDGAAILYVVDGSIPPSVMNEAEMEILRWTGQPRMALINLVEEEDYSDSWRAILDQYFNLVRVFDAHEADFQRRRELLYAIRELNDPWRETLDIAIRRLEEDRRECQHQSAAAMAEMLVDMLIHTDRMHLSATSNTDSVRRELERRYFDWLRRRESRCHEQLKKIYGHANLKISVRQLQAVHDDLFSESSMNRLGFTKSQLVATSATGGAIVGGTIDATTFGASFMLGTILGGAAGAAAGYYGMKRLPKAVVGGDALKIGPMTTVKFPGVVVDRALLLHRALADRAHARRDNLQLEQRDVADGIVTQLPKELHKQLEAAFVTLRKQGAREQPNRQVLDRVRRELTDYLQTAICHAAK